MIALRFFILAFLFATGLAGQELPPVLNYAPQQYHGENQNWSISQAKSKIIYVANNKSLLEFNGAKWKRYPSPNETVIRSVNVIDDKIYTGAYMDFGYWQKDDTGLLRYHSLTTKTKSSFLPDEEFWNIWEFEGGVVFQSLRRLYRYNPNDGTILPIEAETLVPRLFKIGQSVYFQKNNAGLFKIEGGRPVLVSDDAAFINDVVVGVFGETDALLVLTRHNGFYQVDKGIVSKKVTSANKLLSEVSVYRCLQLTNGTYVLGTISHGLIHLDSDGNLLFHLNQINGLRNNTVLSLFEDLDNNVWLGLNNGIAHIDFDSPFRVYRDNRGILGTVYASLVTEDIMYLGTNQGLFYKRLDQSADFTMIPGTQGQVWTLTKVGEAIFCGHNSGTFEVIGNQVQKVADVTGTWRIIPKPDDKNILLQGNYDGLYVLEQTGGQWQLREKVKGFENSSRFIEVLNTKVFVNHEYKGVYEIELNDAWTEALQVKVDTTLKGYNSSLIKYQNEILFAYQEGILRYEPNQGKFERDSLLSQAYSKAQYVSGKLVTDSENRNLWMFSKPRIMYASTTGLGTDLRIKSIPLTEEMRDGIVGYENVSPSSDTDTYVFGNTSGYITLSLNQIHSKVFSVHLGAVDKVVLGRTTESLRLSGENEFEHDSNSIELSFYTPEYGALTQPQYQYRLTGIYDDWSVWSEKAEVRFENLPPGAYEFAVRAKMGNVLSNNMAKYAFTIKKPWYLSNVMWFFYIIGGLFVGISVHTLYRGYYHKRQRNIIAANQKEMELQRVQSEKEIIRIKNEQLRKEFQDKSNELAASTMSIIKKNELLYKAKEQLMASEADTESIRPIIHTIDKNLNQSDDWELFKEAFNNADRKFLKKLKKVHPNLSPNDIKLCAYLRLNLSSKEIAPLLNISARSVEIKRYRLRKKLGLEHNINLVDYILKL
ncbi:MAG: triple tyrosine motif-containing protein [Bacteroidota bacterium]